MEGDPVDWKLMIGGNEAVGKSKLYHLIPAPDNVSFQDSYQPTIGVEFRRKVISSKNKTVRVSLQVWTGSGQPRFRSITAMYFRSFVPLIALLVYDVTDAASAAALQVGWYEQTVKPGAPPNAHIVVVGNKADLLPDGGASLTAAACVRAGRLPAAAVESSTSAVQTAAAFCEAEHFPHYVVSAKTKLGVGEMFAAAFTASLAKEGFPVSRAPGGVRLPLEGPVMRPPQQKQKGRRRSRRDDARYTEVSARGLFSFLSREAMPDAVCTPVSENIMPISGNNTMAPGIATSTGALDRFRHDARGTFVQRRGAI